MQDEIQVIDHQQVVSKSVLHNMNNQISILHNTIYQLSITCNNKRDEIAYLKNQIQALVGYIDRLKSEDQQQQKIGNETHS